jgi:ATP-dependent RNA helicase DeaD
MPDPPKYYVSAAPEAAQGAQQAASAPPARTEGEPSDEPDAVVQVFVNVGTREGLRPADVQQLLQGGGIGADDVGGIRVRDRMTFVGIRRALLPRVIALLSGQVIGGRTVVAELARTR